MNLTDAATNLRDYLVEQDFAGDDGDIPDHIWQPFCAALQQAESGGSAATNKPSTPCPCVRCANKLTCKHVHANPDENDRCTCSKFTACVG